MKKTWDKGGKLDKDIERFTIGRDNILDMRLAGWDIIATAAHVRMLKETGLMKDEELSSILNALNSLFKNYEKGELKIEEGVEDIHSQIEIELTRQLGERGEKIHAGRSRNDQILTDMRLYLRHELSAITGEVSSLASLLLSKAGDHKEVLMPGYTHSMIAMVSSFGMWFASWAESLTDDLLVIENAIILNNRNPLGSAAGYGTNLPVDRDMTCSLLEFKELNIISSYCHLSGIKSDLAALNALAAVAFSISKISAELILYSGQNYCFFTLPDDATTGSSIMPQKKNPDVLELTRAKCNRIMSKPNEVLLMLTNLNSGYHRDMQLLKEAIISCFDELNDCLRMISIVMKSVSINPGILHDPLYQPLLSTNEVNRLVKTGVPFRQAYRQVAKSYLSAKYELPSVNEFTHQGSIGNLCTERIKKRIEEITGRISIPDRDKLAEKLLKM
ncbi:MAG: argininosuccinate lyase [Bacteroidota bacterium]